MECSIFRYPDTFSYIAIGADTMKHILNVMYHIQYFRLSI